MPAVSAKQQRFMGMCAANPGASANCPPQEVAKEFAHKPAGGYQKPKKPAKAHDYRSMARGLLGR